MLAGLALLAAASATAESAERAFAAMAQRDGQWTAFRAFAAPNAIMFMPEPRPVEAALSGRSDPPLAVMWWPAKVFDSCDGTAAVTTGPWVRAAEPSFGTFTTIWNRRLEGWRWRLDHGRDTPQMVPAGRQPAHVRPDCARLPTREQGIAVATRNLNDVMSARQREQRGDAVDWTFLGKRLAADFSYQGEGVMPSARLPVGFVTPPITGGLIDGNSDDGTLRWRGHALAGAAGAHDLMVEQWRGPEAGWEVVLYETIGLAGR